MNLKKTYPFKLQGRIAYYYSLQADIRDMADTTHRHLPDGTLELIVNLGDPVLQSFDGVAWSPCPDVMLKGLFTQRQFVRYTGKVHLTGAVFRPGYASVFVNDRLEHFSRCAYPAEWVYSPSANRLPEMLLQAVDTEQRHRLLEDFLAGRTKERRPDDNVEKITRAVSLIHQYKGNTAIPFLYESVFMSERNFRRQFTECVGIGAKQYASIIRVKSVVKSCKSSAGLALQDTIFSHGYCDFSHFNRDFKRIAGLSPSDFFKGLHPVDRLYLEAGRVL